MSVDNEYYMGGDRYKSEPFGHTTLPAKEQEDLRLLTRRIHGMCAKAREEEFLCLKKYGPLSSFKCMQQTNTYISCYRRAKEVLETQYGAKMKGKRSTMRDREVEERLGDARAERLAHAQHLDNVREAARKSQQK